MEALVGSANFTKAAFEKNTETMICISNQDINAKATFHKLIQEIENYHQRAKIFTKDDLISYKQIWNKKLKTRDDYTVPTCQDQIQILSYSTHSSYF